MFQERSGMFSQTVSRRRALAVAATATGAFLLAGCSSETATLNATPEPTPRPSHEELVQADQIDILRRVGVYGQLPLMDIKEIDRNDIKGSSVSIVGTGNGSIEGKTKKVYRVDYELNTKNPLIIPGTEIDYEKVAIQPIDQPDFKPTIEFTFDMRKFYDIGSMPGVEYIKGARDLGNNPRTYVTNDDILSATIRMNLQQYHDFRDNNPVFATSQGK